jgi:hypothetical protein
VADEPQFDSLIAAAIEWYWNVQRSADWSPCEAALSDAVERLLADG